MDNCVTHYQCHTSVRTMDICVTQHQCHTSAITSEAESIIYRGNTVGFLGLSYFQQTPWAVFVGPDGERSGSGGTLLYSNVVFDLCNIAVGFWLTGVVQWVGYKTVAPYLPFYSESQPACLHSVFLNSNIRSHRESTVSFLFLFLIFWRHFPECCLLSLASSV